MKSLLHRLAWASAGVAVACGLASRAAANDIPSPLPPPEPCGTPRVVCPQAPKVIVEVPPPNVIIRAAAAPCAPECKETLLQKICHFNCQPHAHHHQRMLVQPMAPQMFVAPQAVAPQVFVAPQAVAPQMFMAPQAVAPQMFVAPQAVAPQMILQPQAFVQPQAVQQHILVPVALAPQAVSPKAVPPEAAGSDNNCDAALRRITSQMETLTKVVETHTQVLTSHEHRIKALEDWANAVKDAPAGQVNPSFPRYAPPK